MPMSLTLSTSRRASVTYVSALVAALSLTVAACSSGGSAGAKVATLNDASGVATSTTVAVNTQEALLAYASCMRDNGIDMPDPTFDADGNPTGGGFGGGGNNSGIDPRSTEFRTAQTACSSHLQGLAFGGRRGGNFDRQAIQDNLNKFTACLRDNGLTVDDVSFGRPPGAEGGAGNGGGFGGGDGPPPGAVTDVSIPVDGSIPPGGFDGPPPGDGGGRGGNGPGGAGFDPTARIIERLNLDSTDPAVAKAVDACKPLLEAAFTPTSTTTPAG